MVYPEERILKIRGIQSHGSKEEAPMPDSVQPSICPI